MSDQVHEILRTQQLRLVDANGRDCAILSAGDNGAVSLKFVDRDNKTRAVFGINEAGQAVIEVGHGGEAPSFSVAVEPDGKVILEGRDAEAVERFKLEIKGNGSHTELSFHEKYKHPRMVLMAEDKGPAGLFIMDQHGKALFSTIP